MPPACAAGAACEVYVKVVVTPNTLDAELEAVCQGIAAVAPETLLVIQPVTPFGAVEQVPSAARLLAWQRQCAATLRHVRLIPQTHRAYGAL